MSTLCLILGDQLSSTISSLQQCDKTSDRILLCEVWEEARYVKHHKKKIAFLFSAMRHFAEALRQDGFQVTYIQLDDASNSGSFKGEIARALESTRYERILVTQPGEYRLLKDMQQWSQAFGLPVEILPDDRFFCGTEQFEHWANGRNQLRMEYFYREMRKHHRILMDGDKPAGGEWNYDAENRKPPKAGLNVPAPYQRQVDPTTQQVIELVAERFSDHFGDLEPFHFAVTREQALDALQLFINERLGCFGDYQDAMIEGEPWMYHSHISFYLNAGLLSPRECVKAAEDAYRDGQAPLNAVEGFIRQILGWREFVRGIYWHAMPDYRSLNFFSSERALPEFYWSGDTQMNCLRQCVLETKQHAYAHHIQRLMVLGNFTLLAGIDPAQVNEWFLIVYADAYEWVELPNVTGMILFADGGLLASKPYAAGGSYINKMSNYCKNCRYKVQQKNGVDACPFNYLYWDFLERNRDKLESNHRIGMMYKTYDRMSEDKKAAIQQDSARFLASL
ncbi:MAG: cryptochrome/photolyase family protein [Ketobacter sp.]|nr:MAG: cryptochrome/photolyase family protein [Ketobacter sp.]